MSKMDELRVFQAQLRQLRCWLNGSDGPLGEFLDEGRSSSYSWTLNMNAVPRDVQDVLRPRLQRLLQVEIEAITEELTKKKQAAAVEEARAVLNELGEVP